MQSAKTQKLKPRSKTEQASDKVFVSQNFLQGLTYHGTDRFGRGVYGIAQIDTKGKIVHLVFYVDAETGMTIQLSGKAYDEWIQDSVQGRTA